MQFQYCQNKLAIPQLWKDNIKNFARNSCNLFIQDHHIIMHHRTINLEELNSKEFCKIQSSLKYEKFSPVYHKKRFDNYHFDCGIPYTATYNTIEKFGSSSVKLFNVLYLHQKLYQFGIVSCSKCCFYHTHDRVPLHLFYEYICVQNIWNQLKSCRKN